MNAMNGYNRCLSNQPSLGWAQVGCEVASRLVGMLLPFYTLIEEEEDKSEVYV